MRTIAIIATLLTNSLLPCFLAFTFASAMGKKTKSKKKRGGGGGGGKKGTARFHNAPIDGQQPQSPNNSSSEPHSNFVSTAGPGCYIAHLPPTITTDDEAAAVATAASDWLLGIEPFHPDDFDADALGDIPEIALDPDEHTVSVTNATAARRVCYVTVYDVPLVGRHGRVLSSGVSIGSDGKERECITFIVLCPPTTFVHLGHLRLDRGQTLAEVELDSDVRDYEEHPDPDDTHTKRIGFPLLCSGSRDDNTAADNTSAAYLCTQGEGGHLTHYMTGNHHAVDFRCPEGTPCVAVCDGTVVDCQDDNTLTGVAVGNLFKWNSISIRADDDDGNGDGEGDEYVANVNTSTSRGGPLYLEYVHIQSGSICVKPGDKVTRGQVICRSGGVGFSPEPHLHFSAFRSDDPTAPTVRVWFEARCDDYEETLFIPKAGLFYNKRGEAGKDGTCKPP